MEKSTVIPDEIITNKIYFVRNQKVMLDADLAELYGVETKQLKRQVKRNLERFPEDFMFVLEPDEYISRSQNGTLKRERMLNIHRWCFLSKELPCYRAF